jgi:hypothetical protein
MVSPSSIAAYVAAIPIAAAAVDDIADPRCIVYATALKMHPSIAIGNTTRSIIFLDILIAVPSALS